jgi:hypothetical protein
LRIGVATLGLLICFGASTLARAEETPPPAPPAQDAASPPVSTLPAPASTAGATPAPPSHADDPVAACVKAAENAQTERSAHRLRSARERLLACAQAGCPMIVRNDCATWLAEVDQLMPSVVVEARDTRGIELIDVRVIVDGELVASHLDGLAVAVDPGTHLFQFEAAGMLPLQQQIVIREGEKGRALAITLAEPAPAPPPSKPSYRPPTATYILGGIGVAGMAGFTYFGIKGTLEAGDLGDTCGKTKTCTESQVAAVRRELIVADISLAIGLVSLGSALYIYLTDKPPAQHAVKPALAVGPGIARFGLEGSF